MTTLQISISVLIIAILFCFFAGLITGNYSHVDRLWSLLPPVYVLIWMKDFVSNPRFLVASILVILWGARLTTNFAIKGGYSFSWKRGFYGEDYRWEILRNKIPGKITFQLFNLLFISTFQLSLIFLFTLPVYFLGSVSAPLDLMDFLLFGGHFLLLIFETIADVQQLQYYKRRGHEDYKENKRVQLGFNTFGLWKFSRHPNYVCELGQWVFVYLFLHSRSGYHFSMWGSVILIALFVGSTIMAESITSSKYDQYANWKKMTAPWIPGMGIKPNYSMKRDYLRE